MVNYHGFIFWQKAIGAKTPKELRKRGSDMEETKVLQQVLRYTEDLAAGRDPAGGRAVPAGSVLREEKMVKCFQYISQALMQELNSREQKQKEQNQGREQPQEERKEEQENRVTLAVFMLETVTSLGFTGFRFFLSRGTSEWLVRKGYLTCERDEDGNPDFRRCRVTQKGSAAGFTESEPYEDGYIAVLCGQRAKEFLRNHLDLIMESEYAQWEPLLTCLTAERRERVVCFPDTVSLRTLLDRVNDGLPADLPRKYSVPAVKSWLVRSGLFQVSVRNGKKRYSVTDAGLQKGFTGAGKLSGQAQQFLLDHLENIARDMASGEAFRISDGVG
jgi:hypothetical protein